jgi:hypothetical protein
VAVFGRFERNRRLKFPRKLVIPRVSENRVKFNSRRLHHSSLSLVAVSAAVFVAAADLWSADSDQLPPCELDLGRSRAFGLRVSKTAAASLSASQFGRLTSSQTSSGA